MGDLATRYGGAVEETAKARRRQAPKLPVEEQKALERLQTEAKNRGVFLTTGGRGGIPPSIVLGILRRDEWKCKRCGTDGADRGGLGIHHKGGVSLSARLVALGTRTSRSNLVTLCKECHDAIHDEDRAYSAGRAA